MTDRIKGLIVTLENGIRDRRDAELIIRAICMIKGVADVSEHVSDVDHHMAVAAVRSLVEHRLYAAIEDAFDVKRT